MDGRSTDEIKNPWRRGSTIDATPKPIRVSIIVQVPDSRGSDSFVDGPRMTAVRRLLPSTLHLNSFALCKQTACAFIAAGDYARQPSFHGEKTWRARSNLGFRLILKPFTTSASHNDTIYALSTAPGRAAIAVIRISGPACLEVCHIKL